MLIVRRAQMEALREVPRRAFYREVLATARRDLPEVCGAKGDEELLETIAWATTRARTIGLVAPPHVARFALFVLRHGRDFEARPDTAWAAAILRERRLVGPKKLERLEAREREGG